MTASESRIAPRLRRLWPSGRTQAPTYTPSLPQRRPGDAAPARALTTCELIAMARAARERRGEV